MTLTAGTRLGAYEIQAVIGAGGMGEVYRALDARLSREVAIKVLPAAVATDPEALARFEREARAVGALSHPNIVSIHDVGTERGISYVVMELLQGETLRARLDGVSGGLPRAKALDIAGQIAHGLAAAHARGIVHRDLKPENIFLTTDGRVKVLDFGLARAVPGAAQAIADAQTQVSPHPGGASVPGLILGTAGYMSPEQVRGQVADHRADIFAFGAVLYEMLTGTRAFAGDSAIEMMSAILKQDPLEQPAAGVALDGPIEALLRHCLEKQPDERFESVRDLAFQLRVLGSGASGVSGATSQSGTGFAAPAQTRSWRRRLVPAAIAIVATLGGLALGRALFGHDETTAATVHSTILLPADVRVNPGGNPARSGGLAVSLDGRQIAFVGQTPKGSQIFVRAIDSPVARPVAGTEGGAYPAWAPDGRRLAFQAAGKLRQVPADGGAAQEITDMTNPRSAATWGPDDTLLYHLDYRQPLSRVPVSGGTPVEVLPAVDGGVSWFSPVWLPDGRHFLVIRFAYSQTEADGAGIYVGAVDSKEPRLLVPGRIAEVALGSNEIFYRKGPELIAHPFDRVAMQVTGNPQVIATHVSMAAAGGPTLVYFNPPGGLAQGHRITWFSRTGSVVSMTGEAATFRDPRLSPDGKSLAIARADEHGLFGIWKYDIARNVDSRVTGTTFVNPTWTPDSRFLLVGSNDGVFRFDADAVAAPQLLWPSPQGFVSVDDTTPDGREALIRLQVPGKIQLAVLPLDGKAEPRTYLPDLLDRPLIAVAPGGQWVAVSTLVGSTQRLHVQPYPGPGPRIPVTTLAVQFPRWRGDGRELYFLGQTEDGRVLMYVPVTWSSGAPEFGPVQTLFLVPRQMVVVNLAFDVTADGQRFVMIVGGDPDPSPLTMVVRGR